MHLTTGDTILPVVSFWGTDYMKENLMALSVESLYRFRSTGYIHSLKYDRILGARYFLPIPARVALV